MKPEFTVGSDGKVMTRFGFVMLSEDALAELIKEFEEFMKPIREQRKQQ
jgi:hypothetical protein